MTDELEKSEEERKRKFIETHTNELMRTTHFPFSPENAAEAMHHFANQMDKINPEHALNLRTLANKIGSRTKDKMPLFIRATALRRIYENPEEQDKFSGETLNKVTAELIKDLIEAFWDSEGNLRSKDAQHAANIRHSKPGGSRDKQEKIRSIWASGKYTSRDICAEQECAALNMSFSAARKALRNTPKPT